MTNFSHIAIVGKIGSGKSTLARMLVEDHGFTRIGLADAVKDIAVDMLNELPNVWITRQELEQNKAAFRPLLQWLGADFWREYMERPNHWVDIFIDRVNAHHVPIVCDDVRFVNEAEALWDAGFMVVRIVRPERERLASSGEQGIAGHPSEMEQDGIMPYLTVPNDKGVAELRGYAEILAEMIGDGGMWRSRDDRTPVPGAMPGTYWVKCSGPTFLSTALDI